MRAHEFITEEDWLDAAINAATKPQTADNTKSSTTVPAGSSPTVSSTLPPPSKDIVDIQKKLNSLGYSVGPHGLDGVLGPDTEGAIKKFQVDNQLPITGKSDDMLSKTLDKQLEKNPEAAKKAKQESEPLPDKISKGNALSEPGFMTALQQVASNLGVDVNSLLSIMKLESKLNPHALNKTSKAAGLIQFMPGTAQGLGTSTAALLQMSAVEQLPYVEKYFKNGGVKPGMSLGDLYMVVFYPSAVGKKNSHVIAPEGSKIATQNPALRDKNGNITVASVKDAANRFA